MVFDLDNTLVDSRNQIVAGLRVAFSDVGLRPPTPGQIEAHLGGTLHAVLDHLGVTSDDVRTRLASCYSRFAKSEGLSLIQTYEGVRAMLGTLTDLGCDLALLTNRQAVTAQAILGATKLERFFAQVVGMDTDGGGDKRDLLDRLALPGGETRKIVVGDHPVDMDCARRLGAEGILACWGTHRPSETIAVPHRKALRPSEVVSLVNSRNAKYS